MARPSKDEYWLGMLDAVASRATCIRRKVGAIITTKGDHVLSMGYNGPASGQPHCIDTPCLGAFDTPGQTGRCEAVHAEQNAIITCTRLDLAYNLYVHCTPCESCAKLICNTMITRVIFLQDYADQVGQRLLLQAGRQLVRYTF